MRKLTHAEIKAQRKNLADIDNYKRNPVYVLCDNIRSIFNVGSIFRTSDAAFIEKIYLTGYTPYPPRKEIEKVALGATLSVPWEYYKNPLDAIEELRRKNIKIICVEITDKRKYYWETEDTDFPLCLILGNEITGVSKELIEVSDYSVEIPMLGMKQSLNVSVAYGVVIYEMVKKLNKIRT